MAQRTGLIELAAMASIFPSCLAGKFSIPLAIIASAAQMTRTDGRIIGTPIRIPGEASICGLAAFIGLGPQPKEPRSIPPCTGNETCDLGEIAEGLAIVGKSVRQHHHAVTSALPFANKDRAGFDPAWQHDLAVRLRRKCFHHLF